MNVDAVHPGVIVRRDCLGPHKLSVTDAAFILGISRQALSSLVSGNAGISPEMALRLQMVFGGTAEAWLQLQLVYDLAEVRKRVDKIKVRDLREKQIAKPQSDLF
jgi:antitoxin HigA-1